MKKSAFLFSLLATLIPILGWGANGDTFTKSYEGTNITFSVVSEDDKTVQVGNGSNVAINSSYSGPITIPQKVLSADNTTEYTVTKIGNSAFYKTKISSVTMPSSVTLIDKSAFMYCPNITSITIPKNVESIKADAFYGCDKLEWVKMEPTTPPSLIAESFGLRFPQTLYVPFGRKKVYETASSYWTKFKEIVEYGTEDTITIPSSSIRTFSSDFDLNYTSIPALKAYIVSGFSPSTGKLILTQVYNVPAGEGVLLKGEAGNYEVPYEETDMVYSNLLKGVTTDTTISPTDGDQTNFILADGAHGINFYTLSEAGNLAAGKAYLHLPTTAVAAMSRPFKLVFDDETTGMTTGVDGICENEKADGAYYDLQGRRIAQPAKGLYIVNGKKVFIK